MTARPTLPTKYKEHTQPTLKAQIDRDPMENMHLTRKEQTSYKFCLAPDVRKGIYPVRFGDHVKVRLGFLQHKSVVIAYSRHRFRKFSWRRSQPNRAAGTCAPQTPGETGAPRHRSRTRHAAGSLCRDSKRSTKR